MQPSLSPDGRRLYVPNAGTDVAGTTVSVVDTTTNTVTGTLATGPVPNGVEVTPDGRHAYVTNYGSGPDTRGSVQAINTGTGATTTLSLGGVDAPGTAADLSPDGGTLLVTNARYGAAVGTVSVFDTATSTLRRRIDLPALPYGVAIAPDSRRAYVTTIGPDGVWLLDLA